MPTDTEQRGAFSDGLRTVASLLWLAGAALALVTGIFSVAHARLAYALVYGVVATCLAVLAVGVRRAVRLAEVMSLVLLGSQILGVVGAAWELSDPDEASAKARHLADLGISYRLALVGNVLYSAVASGVFGWAMLGAWRRRAARPQR